MSLSTVPYDLAPVLERALHSAAPWEVTPIRRAFKKALWYAEQRRDLAPAVLLAARWP